MAVGNFSTANQTYRMLMGNGLIYSVPRFQRDYSWTDEEWDDLWRDIENTMSPDGETAHYMGYLVLQSKDSKNFDIIDGQQRLTTLSIIVLAVLSNLQKLIDEETDAANNKRRQVKYPQFVSPPSLPYDKYFPTIGIRRPMPKALVETRSTGAVW